MLVITVGLVGGAAATGSTAIVGYNLVWAYVLVAAAIVSAIVCALIGMATAPAGIKATLISVGLVAVVIFASYFVAAGHDIKIADIGTPGTFFGAEETVISEASILVTYTVFGAVVLMSLISELMGLAEGLKKSKRVEEEL